MFEYGVKNVKKLILPLERFYMAPKKYTRLFIIKDHSNLFLTVQHMEVTYIQAIYFRLAANYF